MQSDLLLGDLGDRMYHFIHLTLRLLVEIPQWERRRDRKHPWSTTQHLEQIRTHPKGIIHFRSYDVTSCDIPSNPVAILLPVMRNDTFYTNAIVRKKRGEITSLPVTWLPFMPHPLAMLLPVMHNCTFVTSAIVRKKARECPSGHVQNILPVMTSLPVIWLHVTSFPVRAASGDVTSSNACAMARSPLLPPKYSLSCPDTLLWYLDWGDPIDNP
jgi:hypothetical protein